MFLRRRLELIDEEQVLERAVRLLDLVTCAVTLDGGKLVVRNRDGSMEVLDV